MNAPVVEGDVIAGRYRVDRVLGRGGMGVVVAASHLILPQRVAIKLLLSHDHPSVLQRFLREARAAARLKGEHVVRVFDVGQPDSGLPYIVMEYLEGEDLSDLLRACGQLTVEEAADYAQQACVALAEAHAAGIVHRDIKPANLFLTTTLGGARVVKVLDFGVSKELPGNEDGGASLTQTREMLGSPLFMSPEQMRSSRSVDARSDIWALGVLLYRMLTGRPPFEAITLPELVLQVADAAPVPPSAFRSDIPPELEAVILRCLEKDPAQRVPTVADLARALAPFVPAGGPMRAELAARILGVEPVALPAQPRASAPAAGPGRHDVMSTVTLAPAARGVTTVRLPWPTVARSARRKPVRLALGTAGVLATAIAVAVAVTQ